MSDAPPYALGASVYVATSLSQWRGLPGVVLAVHPPTHKRYPWTVEVEVETRGGEPVVLTFWAHELRAMEGG